MPVIAHAEHHHVEGRRNFREHACGFFCRLGNAFCLMVEADKGGSGGLVLQKVLGDQPGIGTRRIRRNETLVHKGDGNFVPRDVAS